MGGNKSCQINKTRARVTCVHSTPKTGSAAL